eukprot:COSAG05_NODE_10673_length_552_cov_1.194260_2_plen_44_part_01
MLLVLYIAVVTPLRVAFAICAPWSSALFTMDLVIDTFHLRHLPL